MHSKAEFCAEHRREGMVYVANTKRCGHHGCTKTPSFGMNGSRKREFCSQHMKRAGCGHHGCTKTPSFGMDGSRKGEFCSQHMKGGVVDLKDKRCGHYGCIKTPSLWRGWWYA